MDNSFDIPIERLYKHPVVQELLSKIENMDLERDVKVPFVIKDKILMSPGIWNGYYYSSEAIHEAYLKTSWDKKEVRSLFLDHEDLSSREWVGEVINPMLKGDTLYGDLVVIDKPTAMKLAYGAKMGISPKVSGGEEGGKMIQFTYDNFSVVINPAVKTAYINNQEVKKMDEKPVEVVNEVKPADVPKEDPKEVPKEVPTEEVKEDKKEMSIENASDLMESLSQITSTMSVGDMVKKAKEIIAKNPDMKWSDAMKKASEEVVAAPEKPAEEMACKPKDEMKMEDVVAKVLETIKKEYPMPYPKKEEAKMSEEQKPVTQEMSELKVLKESVESKDKIIQELSEKLQVLEARFNEPDRQSVCLLK